MQPYHYEQIARHHQDELMAAAAAHRLAREDQAPSRLVVPRRERRGLLARRVRAVVGRFGPARAGGYVGPVRWTSHPSVFPSELSTPETPGNA